MSAEASVAVRQNPLSEIDRLFVMTPIGTSIEELIAELGLAHLDLRVMVGDELVVREQWATYRLSDPDRPIVIKAVAEGIESTLLIILAALAQAATYATPGFLTAAAASLGAGAGGALGLGALGITAFSLGAQILVGVA